MTPAGFALQPGQEAPMKAYLMALGCAALVIGFFEWRTDEDAVTLMVLVTASGALGALRPGLFWLSALALGSVVAVLNLFTTLTGLRPVYETAAQAKAHGVAYGVSLAILIVPALAAAGVGAFVRRSMGKKGSPPGGDWPARA
jgi:hypothetical protein